jgi:hypothetical protein
VTLALALLAGILAPVTARGSWTAPPLAVTAVDATPSARGTLLRLDGLFPAADLVGRPYPLEVFLSADDGSGRIISFSAAWGTKSGQISFADELDLADLVRLAPWFLWPEPDGEIVHLGETRIEVLVPPGFPSGPADIVLSVDYQGVPVLSNVVSLALP